MASNAELSSLSSSLEELSRRITAFAEDARGAAQEDVAHELFAIERSLNGALRRLRRVAEGSG